MPPLAVRIPAAACMPPTSSGLVSVLTYIFAKKIKNEAKCPDQNKTNTAEDFFFLKLRIKWCLPG
jgi:hypothetical protein